jgi:Fe-S-cluster-containing dehydrogenase component
MAKDKTKKEASRRAFLKSGLFLGAGALTTAGLFQAIASTKTEETGRKIRLLSQDGKIVEVDEAVLNTVEQNLTEKEIKVGIPGRKFVMVIDLAKCKNVRACIVECQKNHALRPDQEFIKLLLMQDSENSAPYWFPKPCYHCDQPPCVKVCPVDATFKRQDGIVLIDNERCIGCKFCVAGCPYSARIFQWKRVEPIPELANFKHDPEKSIPHKTGTVSKCDFCPDMSRLGKLPHCVTACPMGVIYFGDLNEDAVTNGEETVRFTDLIRDRAGYRHLEDLGTEPLVYYLPPVNRQFTVESGFEGLDEEVIARYKDTPFVKSGKLNKE